MEITHRSIKKLEKRITEKEAIISDYSNKIKLVKSESFRLVGENAGLVIANKKLEANNKGISKRSRSNKNQRNVSICLNIAMVIALILANG